MFLILLGKLTMFKNWLIAGGVFLVGLAAAVLIGKRKATVANEATVKEAVNEALNTIAETTKEVNDHVEKLPNTGPGSAGDELRNDWSER